MQRTPLMRRGLIIALTVSAAAFAEDWRPVLERAGVRDARVLEVMQQVDRADFLPPGLRAAAMVDRPLPIGHQQTTSQPSLIALMLAALQLQPGCRVLEVGTGSGYQTALLARLCARVYSIDIVKPLAREAARRLEVMGVDNAEVRAGDGYLGWPEAAPFDGIVVCAAAPKVPQPLLEQLKPGGRLIIPVGPSNDAQLLLFEKGLDGVVRKTKGIPVSFVPLLGEHAEKDRLRYEAP